MKITRTQLRRIIREALDEEDSQAVIDAVGQIAPEMENMSSAELQLLDMQIDDLIAQLSESQKRIAKQDNLKTIIRESIQHQDRMVLEEGKFQDVMGWMKKKGQDAKVAMKDFLEKLKVEMSETKEGAQILAALASGQEISKENLDFVKDQIKDLGKGTAMLGLFVLPGGGIAATALVKVAKKFGVNLMPSAFADKEDSAGVNNATQ